MNEAKLRAEWERQTSIADRAILDEMWRDLVEDGEVKDALKVGERGIEDLLDATKKVRKYYRMGQGRKPPSVSRTRAPVEVELSERDYEHAEVLSLYLSKQAALRPEVRRFRERVLDGSPLSTDEPGPVREFLRNEIDSMHDLPRIDPAYHPEQLTDVEDLKDLVVGGIDLDQSVVYPYRVPSYPLPSSDVIDLLSAATNYRYPYESGVMDLISDGEGQNLGDLGRRLAAVYPWEPGEVAWFVLTGEAPKVEPVRLSHDEVCGTFTLTFMPWVSKQTMRRVHRVAQRRSSGELKGKALEVFRFVTERTEPRENKPWEKLLAEWNEQHPDRQFANRSSIASAYRRTEEKLVAPWMGVSCGEVWQWAR